MANLLRFLDERSSRFRAVGEIMGHQFFSGLNWDRLQYQEAPFKPELDSFTDAGYFDNFETDDILKYTEVQEKHRNIETQMWETSNNKQIQFPAFTYR
jgi:cell cycle protein kinase DBF2